jgi:hypothetical protein
MMRKPRPWAIPYLDLSNVLLFFFMVLFAVTLLAIADSEAKKKVDTTSKLLVHLVWQDGSPNDMDLWLMTPAEHAVSFKSRQADFASLDHDNLGLNNGVVTDAGGNPIVSTARDEVIFIRQTMPGTYVVNIHAYHLYRPEQVTVTLTSVDPSYRVVTERKMTFTDTHEEQTAFRFTVDAGGQVTSTDTVPDLFVNELLSRQ